MTTNRKEGQRRACKSNENLNIEIRVCKKRCKEGSKPMCKSSENPYTKIGFDKKKQKIEARKSEKYDHLLVFVTFGASRVLASKSDTFEASLTMGEALSARPAR